MDNVANGDHETSHFEVFDCAKRFEGSLAEQGFLSLRNRSLQ